MSNFFGKLKYKLCRPTASVFVDFEHWCYSLENLFGMRPDVGGFIRGISKNYRIRRIYFFGDFTSASLRNEINDIREFTNNIIDTQNPSSRSKKDYTDFIMLDYMYRDIEEKQKSNTYIIFSGDGHFASVCAYLKNKKKKKLVIYGIENATSNRLRSVADECVILPTAEQENNFYKKLVLDSISYNQSKYGRKHYTTFRKTMESVASYNNVDQLAIKKVMNEMMESGVLVKKEVSLGTVRKITTIEVDWQAAVEQGLWTIENVG